MSDYRRIQESLDSETCYPIESSSINSQPPPQPDKAYEFDSTKTADLNEAKLHGVTSKQQAQKVRFNKNLKEVPYNERCKCCLMPFVTYS